MYCLHCGDCCRRMSPLNRLPNGECPRVICVDGFYICADYEHRPKQCQNHEFPSHVCPIGASVLDIHDTEQFRLRVDRGWELCQTLARESK